MTASIATLTRRVIRSGSWVVAGYFTNHALRFAGNLVLTRLLFPEAFGLMAIVQAVIYGVTMLSDVGIAPAIVQNAHGDSATFLNTAWSLQILRGTLMWLSISLLALPLANLYGEPALSGLLAAAALTALVSGFNSTKLATADRNLNAVRVTLIEVGSYAVGLVLMIFLAWRFKSVWALVWGNVAAALIKAVASHRLLPGLPNRVAWDGEASRHLLHFGKWVFLSSAVTFLAGEGNKLLIAGLLDLRQLSFYTLASSLSLLLSQAMQQLAGKVLFPAYAEIARHRPAQMRPAVIRARLALVIPSWLVAAVFVTCGDRLVAFLYDPRYHEAGAMLQILAIGSLAGSLGSSYNGVLWATGRVAANTALLVLHVIVQMSCIVLGHHFFGPAGVAVGLAAAGWLIYPAYAWLYRRLGLWFPGFDLSLLAVSLAVVLFAWGRIGHA